jgi:hypothetical protein
MKAVTIVGMIAGGILILTAVAVFLIKKEFPSGGVAVTMVGMALIGMTQWSSIKITAQGIEVQRIAENTRKIAAAVDEVAAQTEQAEAGIEATRQQVVALTAELETRHVLPSESSRAIGVHLSAVPRIDRSKLAAARSALQGVAKQ